MRPVIAIEDLSKAYRLGTIGGGTLREDLNRWIERLRGRARPREEAVAVHPERLEGDLFWALRNVCFEVAQGEVVGIIGRNGAGKSTLLKILSRVTGPTEGRVKIRGRVASLLEVGTGFHPELTGRENVFLNGAILGMTRAEIRARFDEIVAFAEMGQFIDTPVKRYSSGMYVRLAFAVAAHLEPEILIVDEVLAVGDAQFQAKCLGKMDEVSRREGRTILFVSHNMSAVRKLCSAAVVVSGGTVSFKGAVAEGVAHYLVEETESVGGWRRRHPLPDRPGIYFREVRICGADGATRAHFDPGETFTVEMRVAVTGAFARPQLSLRFTNLEGVAAFCTCSTDHAGRFLPFEPGERTFRVTLDAGYLMPGRYALHLGAHLPRDRGFDQVDHQLSIEIGSVGSLTTLFGDERPGVVLPVIEWRERP